MEAFVKKIANVISTPIFRSGLLCGAVSVALAAAIWPTVAQSQLQAATAAAPVNTASPIKHVIVVVGENRTFDHVFGAYTPRQGQTVANLLSKGIITADGRPGPNFALAAQYTASATDPKRFEMAPGGKQPYTVLPAPNTGSTASTPSDTSPPPFATLTAAQAAEGAMMEPWDVVHLTTGASGLPTHSVDTRFGSNTYNLPNGPYQISRVGPDYDQYINSPVHRFYQNWQEADCSLDHATLDNPSGCQMDLFAWVETSVGAGSNGKPRPANFNDETTGEGATALGYYNVNTGDMPYFTHLARQFTISDNYHQPVMGGTGANSIMIGTSDALYYTDGNGNATKPPADQIENPLPQANTNNYYTQDGYSGGTYSNCSDSHQPGAGALRQYLNRLPYKPDAKCAPNTYYLLNNYNPGYNGDGTVNTSTFTIPPSPVRTIADTLIEKNISWKYYGEGWNTFVTTPATSVYCNICNPFLYETAIMTNPALVKAHLQDTTDLYADIANGTLPAVSFVKPGGLLDGHPESSKFGLFESFVHKLVDTVQRDPSLWASTAILVTTDEGGGYYDSGYIQPLDFFGDGPRIPMIVVSPYSRGGRVVHQYGDHASIVKFIDRNWHLKPITERSRDNLPNPIQLQTHPYVPVNAPAIDDLFDAFEFPRTP
ncbi:alkaline phosphatase family protein [Paraburkholderia madseniana]|uniref:Phosphoesterase n=1 Tax=Paraburkholderia madseniana TaxID=2599607 RepID=A0AAP5ERW9_9BURK|nr:MULTISPECIES: alkaline phosphatase family protein [Paraburkholderia]MCX4149476.1 phosphoesterase [Paraburkholderia madseniana]MDN7152412.1 phosphoesterase [Paraburkholderia sp. WS6]MDQ6411294.1 phosphoesterase [Paraburkholderia madseniana]